LEWSDLGLGGVRYRRGMNRGAEKSLSRLALSSLVLLSLLPAREAHADNEVEALAWTLPSLAGYVVLHEGAHALAAKMMGAETVTFNWFPNRRAVAAVGIYAPNSTSGERAFSNFAPLISDLALLGSFLVISEVAGVSNEHVLIPLTLMAAWGVGDIGIQAVPLGYGYHHVENVYRHFGLSQWQRIPFRVVHVATAVVGAYFVRRGLSRITEPEGESNAPRALGVAIEF